MEQLSSADALALTPDWVRHGDPQQQAWAAYWIQRDRQEQEVPLLLEVLASYQASAQAGSSGWTDQDTAMLYVLDTLIQMHSKVTSEQAEALYGKFPVQALILLAHDPEDARDPLLRILDKTQSRIDWLAAADLLATDPPAGFAARLLKGISIHATIRVLSPGQGGLGGLGSGCGGSAAWGRGDWPPLGVYRLSTRPSTGSELFAKGENPVYVKRSVEGSCDASEGCGDLLLSLEALRRDLIGQLLGIRKEKFALQLNPSLNITWSSDEAYFDAASAFVAQQEEILENAQAGLEARGLLTETEAASAQPPFEVEILDLRNDKTPLPDLVFADPSINVTYRAVELDPAD
ncbi:MAG TPA: hypothetical protein VKM93_06640 [Terriglobia bacterium]|nr:hypothetical protein [Terriglobia bacterium]